MQRSLSVRQQRNGAGLSRILNPKAMVAVADDVEVLPRGGRSGERGMLAAGALVLLLVSPLAPIVAAVSYRLVMGQVSRGWRDISIVGLSLSAAVVVVEWLAGVSGVIGWVVWSGVLAVPLGVAAGAGAVGLLERWVGGAEWHPVERRKQAVAVTHQDRVVARALARAVDRGYRVLGAFHGGDLAPWVRGGRYVVPPVAKFPAMGVIGESGSGKTVTVERLNWLWGQQGIRVIFADFKGSDPELPPRVIAAYLDARPDAVCKVWPTQPLDIWQGDHTEIVNRLLQVQAFSEPFYEQAAMAAVRLAVNVPGVPTVRDSAEFLRRLDLDYLTKAYERTPQAADVHALKLPQVMDGVRLRYAGFFSALGSRFDHGFSWGDADLSVLSIPTLAQPSDAMAAARMVLADFGAYCMNRKPRDERVVFVVDEFSAVTGAAPMVIDLAERVRDAGGMVVACVQSFEGLGRNAAERDRMLDALLPGGIVIHRTGNPADILKLAGTQHVPEQSWHLNEAGRTGHGVVKMDRKLSIDPDAIRRLRTGSAYVLTHGRALQMSVIPTPIRAEAAARARVLIDEAEAALVEPVERVPERSRPGRQWVPGVDRVAKPRKPKEIAGQETLL